jgi:hypothetical protein
MLTKSHIHETYETFKKTSFCTKGYAEIHKQRPFFDIKNGILKILVLKIQMMCTCFGAPSTHGSFIFEEKPKSQFLIEFWQFWAVIGNFRQILLHWQWLAACPNFT